MNLKAHIVIDEEVRKQIKAAILEEAKGLARGEVHAAMVAEAERVFRAETQKIFEHRWDFNRVLSDALKGILESRAEEVTEAIAKKIDDLAEKAVNKLVAKKLADKTVFEAEKQHDYVVKIVRAELKKAFSHVRDPEPE